MRVEMLLSLFCLLLAMATPEPDAERSIAKVGELLRVEGRTEREFWLPDRAAVLKLAPGSRAVAAEGGHDVSLYGGSARIEPRRAEFFSLQTADVKRRANVRIEGEDGAVLSLSMRVNHDVRVSVEGGKALVMLAGWPGANRVLNDGAALLIPAAAEKLPEQ